MQENKTVEKVMSDNKVINVKAFLKALIPMFILIGSLFGGFALNMAILSSPQNIEIKRPDIFSWTRTQMKSEQAPSEGLKINSDTEAAVIVV